jgi:hypothetical protein
LRAALDRRKKLLINLLELWGDEENQLFNELSSPRKAKKYKESRKEVKKVSLIPTGLKFDMITKKIKEITKQYGVKMKNFKAHKKMLTDSLIGMSWFHSNNISLMIKKPDKPNLEMEIDRATIRDLIKTAMKARSSWRGSISKLSFTSNIN